MLTAYCFRSGEIGFGPIAPKETLFIARHANDQKLQDTVKGFSRRSYDNKYLVPGVPEAPNDREAVMAVCKFMKIVTDTMEKKD